METARLSRLLEEWLAALERGEEISVERLCADAPELAAELSARVEEWRRKTGKRGPTPTGGQPTPNDVKTASCSTPPASPPPRVARLESPTGNGNGHRTEVTSDRPTVAPSPDWPDVPGYEIRGELGRGGMGVVYKAKQVSLGRLVALKMISRAQSTDEGLARFLNEARSLASLHHSGIVQVYEVGEVAGQAFFSLELVEGGSLTQKMTGPPWEPQTAAALMEKVARAVDYAHRQGIIHRDIKPGNILLTPEGEPKVVDFGLAKNLQLTQPQQTASGVVMGTPGYMAPEQVRGEAYLLGAATDVFALGVVLYQMLTGRLPFSAESPLSFIFSVQQLEPIAPRRRNRKVPPELEMVCLKCLNKDPADRYPSALEVAEELARFLRREPVQARRPRLLSRAVKWVRRRPTLAAVYLLSFLLLTVGGAGAIALRMWRLAERASVRLAEEKAQTEAALLREQEANTREAAARVLLARANYRQSLTIAEQEFRNGDHLLAVASLEECPADLRGWEWHYLSRTIRESLRPFGPPVRGLRHVQASADGLLLVGSAEDGVVRLWELPSGAARGELKVRAPGALTCVDLDPRNKHLLVAADDQKVRLLSLPGGEEVAVLEKRGETIRWARFSPDGKTVVACAEQGSVHLWQPFAPSPGGRTLPHPQRARAVFSPDGRAIATACQDRKVRLWDAETGNLVATLEGHEDRIYCVAFSPDGRRLATGATDGTIRVWDAEGRKPAQVLRGHASLVMSVAFSPDGRRVVSGGSDQFVKVWDVETGRELASSRHHAEGVRSVLFDRARDVVYSAASDGLRAWSLGGGDGPRPLPGAETIAALATAPDGSLLAAGRKDGSVTAWDPISGKQAWASPTGHNGAVRVLAFSPRSDRIVTGGEDALLIVRDVRTGQELFREPAHQHAVSAVAFSPDGNRIASGGADGGLRVWEAGTDRLTLVTAIAAYQGPGGTNPYPGCLAFSPDGKVVVVGPTAESGYLPRPIQVWDARSGARVREMAGPVGRTTSLNFDADGRLYSAGQDRIVRVWDLTDGKVLRTLKGHRSEVVRMTFSPDARSLAVAARDGGVHLWHAGDGRPLVVLRDLSSPAAALSFSPDGTLLFAATPTEGVMVWDGAPCPP